TAIWLLEVGRISNPSLLRQSKRDGLEIRPTRLQTLTDRVILPTLEDAMSNAVSLSEEIIVSLAPDAASVKAAKQLVQRGAFSQARRSPDGRWLLAHAQGSMPRPYVTKAELVGGEARFSCECGSMKYPCKHALGLLYLATQQPGAFAETSAIASNS